MQISTSVLWALGLHLSRIVIVLLLVCVAITAFPKLDAALSQDEISLYSRINDVRSKAGLNPLHLNDLLVKVAQEHSMEMLNSGYFDHTSHVDGSTPYDRVVRSGYYDGYYGMRMVLENIALTGSGVDVDSVMDMWMNSKGHADNILNSYVNDMGVGVALGVYQNMADTALYTAVFAYRASGEGNNLTITASTGASTAFLSTSTESSTILDETASTSTIIPLETTSTGTTQVTTQTFTAVTTVNRQTVTPSTFITTVETSLTQQGNELRIQIVSNSTIRDLAFDSSRRSINFSVNGPYNTEGFCRAVIAKQLLDGIPLVYVDENQVDANITEDTTNYYVYFIYGHSSHSVGIYGSNTIPEFVPYTTLIVLTLVSIMILKRRRQTVIKD